MPSIWDDGLQSTLRQSVRDSRYLLRASYNGNVRQASRSAEKQTVREGFSDLYAIADNTCNRFKNIDFAVISGLQ